MATEILGYETMNGDMFVPVEDALDYALEQSGFAIADDSAPDCEEAVAAFLFWFYSNWVEVEKECESLQ